MNTPLTIGPYLPPPSHRPPKRPSSPRLAETQEELHKQKQPRLSDLRAQEFGGRLDESPSGIVQIKLGLSSSKLGLGENGPDLVVRCGRFTWDCHGDVLAERCSFFGACLGRGFMESTTRQIILEDDEPRAVQAMLRYLYTLDCAQIYRASDPLFSDVERDLDVFAIADKYGLDELRDYMTAQLRRFYETDQRPPGDPKEWSAKNQEGFGRVLRKVHAMEMEAAGAIRRAIAGFVVRREKMVRKWGVVEEVISEGVWLGNEMLLAVLAHNKQLTETVGLLEAEVQELKAEMEVMETEREELEGEVEYLSELQAGDDLVDRVEMYEEYCNDMCQDSYYYGDDADYHVERMLMAEEMDSKGETVHVEDLLSGVSFAFGAEGPMDPDDVEEWWVD